MKIIRDITNDAVTLGVAKTLSTDDVLSQLKRESWLQKERVLVSKKEWSKQVKICEMTLIRWEKSIIAANRSFRVSYWDMKGNAEKIARFNSGKTMGYRLDYFQRFIIATISIIKRGGFTEGIEMKYDHEVVAWLEQTQPGQSVQRWFDRDLFNQQSTKQQRKTA